MDVKLTLTKDELEYLEIMLHNHEYKESERHLIDQLEYKFNKIKSKYYQNKLTADRRTVGNWIELWSQKEIDEVLTDLINDDYTVEMLSQDYDEWVKEEEK